MNATTKVYTGTVTARVFASKVADAVEIALSHGAVTRVTISDGTPAHRRSIKAKLVKKGYVSLPSPRGTVSFAPRPSALSTQLSTSRRRSAPR